MSEKLPSYCSFELYYDTGGHGGPYSPDLAMAVSHAKRLIAGCPSINAIEIRPCHANAPIGGFSRKNIHSVFVERE